MEPAEIVKNLHQLLHLNLLKLPLDLMMADSLLRKFYKIKLYTGASFAWVPLLPGTQKCTHNILRFIYQSTYNLDILTRTLVPAKLQISSNFHLILHLVCFLPFCQSTTLMALVLKIKKGRKKTKHCRFNAAGTYLKKQR